jgi:DNA-binding beta-propeller fold protein YncE
LSHSIFGIECPETKKRGSITMKNSQKTKRRICFGLAVFLLFMASPGIHRASGEAAGSEEPAFPYILRLKSAPPEAELFYRGEPLRPRSSAAGVREYLLEEGPGRFRLHAPGYRDREFESRELPSLLKAAGLEMKLEPQGGPLEYLGEYETGWQPKSAVFSPEGNRIFVPLLAQRGVDVFRFSPKSGGPAVVFEKRLAVPGSGALGFVEPMIDGNRREFWVSNMEEGRLHIFNLDTLEYKSSVAVGRMPKVILLSPGGDTVAVSNWLSQDISLLDGDTKKTLALIPAGGTPRGMAFSPDGALLYTALFDGPFVAVISVPQQKVIARFRLAEGEGAARHVIYHGGRLYVSDMYRGRVYILDPSDGKVLKSLRVGSNVNTIALSPDGSRLYVSSRGRNNPADYTKPGPEFGSITVLSSGDLSLLGKVWGRNQPTGLAVSPGGDYLVFTDFLDANLELYRVAD